MFKYSGIFSRFMQRSLIQLAENTLVVSLPSKWIKSLNLKKGDVINITPAENKLIVSPDNVSENSAAKISLPDSSNISRRIVNTAYKRGFDEVDLFLENPAVIKDVKNELSGLLGFEIINQGRNSCLIKNIASPMEKEFDNVLRKIFLMILEMGDGCLNDSFDEVFALEDTIDKLTNFCKRCLNKRQFVDPKNTTLLYCVVWELEKIADEYYNVAKVLSKKKTSPQSLKSVNDFFRIFYDLFYKRSSDLDDDFEKAHLNIIKKLSLKQDPEVTHYLINIVERIYDAAGPLYAMIL